MFYNKLKFYIRKPKLNIIILVPLMNASLLTVNADATVSPRPIRKYHLENNTGRGCTREEIGEYLFGSKVQSGAITFNPKTRSNAK